MSTALITGAKINSNFNQSKVVIIVSKLNLLTKLQRVASHDSW